MKLVSLIGTDVFTDLGASGNAARHNGDHLRRKAELHACLASNQSSVRGRGEIRRGAVNCCCHVLCLSSIMHLHGSLQHQNRLADRE
jgi:hypothetical protein